MKGRILELSRRLVIEERFIAIKNLPRFIRRTGGSATEGKRYIDRQIFFGYNVSVAAMIAFSALLTVTQVRLPYHLAHIQTLSLVLYSYIFLISLYSFLMHANVVISYKLMEPLKLLPTDMEDSVLPLSWFIFTGSPSLFVIIPPLTAYIWYTGNIYSVFFGITWAFIMLVLGYSAGSAMVFALNGKNKEKRHLKNGVIANIVRVSLFILVFALFEVAMQIPQEIPILPVIASFPLYMAVPLLGILYIVFSLGESLSFMFFGIAITVLYVLVATFSFRFINKRTIRKIIRIEMEQAQSFSPSRKNGKTGYSFYGSLIWKDLKTMVRNPQNLLMVLIPAFLVLPTLISLFFFSPDLSFNSVSIYYSMITIVVLASAFYSMTLLMSEGDGIRILQTLPVRNIDLMYSKGFVGILLFTFIVVPVSVIFFLRIHGNPVIFLLFPVNLVIAYSYSTLFSLRRLLKKIPKGADTVNFYTFGGSYELIALFILSSVLAGIPAIASTIVQLRIPFETFSSQASFYLMTFAMNEMALFLALKLSRKGLGF